MSKMINQSLKRTARKAHPLAQDNNHDITCPACGHVFPHESGTSQATDDGGIGDTAMMTPGKIWLQRNRQRRK